MKSLGRRHFLRTSVQFVAGAALAAKASFPLRAQSPSQAGNFSFGPGTWALRHQGRLLAENRPGRPCCFVGSGVPTVKQTRGSFAIEDYVEERVPLSHARVEERNGTLRVFLSRSPQHEPELVLALTIHESGARIEFESSAPTINRLWWRVPAEPGEAVWGGGEQFSYFNLRGRHFPLWVSEEGVGRDKSTLLTWKADVASANGGDYFTTSYPQPTFISSARYCFHADSSAYADFDFRHPEFHELQFWAVPRRLEFLWADRLETLVERIAERFGRQPRLPAWLSDGAILGLKNGRDHADHILALSQAHGLQVAGLWCEDWAGIRPTAFGKRVFWDWRWNERQYPGAREWVAGLKAKGVRFLGYINPYLCTDGTLFREAHAAGFLVTHRGGGDYLLNFGEFDAGMVDFTNPRAADWYAERVIGKELLAAGLDGWMADFGEYLPTDARLSNGADPMLAHNQWPTLWAKVNAQAIAQAGRTGDAFFFMRSGYTGIQAACPLLWAGDQNVDFSRHDGLPSVICAALSSGLMGNAYHHSDIGGYTSLFENHRTPELFQRWAEMAAFTPVMRTHEGNRPDENFQFWQDDGVLAHFARMTRIHTALARYVQELVEEAATRGLPLQRPLVLHYEDDPQTYGIQDQYLYGKDLLVAPVHEAGRNIWEPYLPKGEEWIHLWSGQSFPGGRRVKVSAPLGQPPVFVRATSRHRSELLALARC